ncbi:MAG: deoxynucleoside kinase [Candidatus Dactylopiibacterium carminicum]|uniref:Deoxynucleoside kinase n=1 Tax=Candidatus Dactylopiibacterium carminicum TaxID=857335 RepID=A0A272ENG8_9RHOO|nr:deoxynucleoside kinase [Candidatus Dactylopiibacterium carminicum]KAF7599259.1 deoxynucleoside kinase [Candidatus Dactylopiibacterium carminicum]PAS91652.1 MAG: deoxynucleoside kinase [Candidatus Dactylopiibacterium carminicum]PAS99267.1 MAG: deoxynucleoside kinase [Candidatus Dactylopiibacterium carminicum]
MLDKARHIVVEGPIGAGKTSLARRLSERLNADLILEQPEANPFLARFYADRERWALATQIEFLFQRTALLGEAVRALDAGQRVVSDFILDKDPLFAGLNLDEDETRLYERLFTELRPAPLRPDLVIYLQAQPDTLIERVRKRGLDAERRITEHYLATVSERYARFFHDFDSAPLFVINAEVLNPVDEDDDFELILQRLQAMRGYREYFSYA